MINEFFHEIFRVVCFLVFATGFVHLIKSRIFPDFVADYAKYKKFILDKIKLKEKCVKHHQEIIEQQEQQRLKALELSKRIAQWASYEHTKSNAVDHELHEAHERLRLYMSEQSRALAFTTACKELVPEIEKQVRSTITQTYAVSQEQQKYVDTVLKALESDSE